ncbi:hypothetical protein NC651_038642 [Populus alba x Populus x berolinensis]|nr:hypothetical protein NC651_038642 [Populus alba x Populus x berolinensis]
MIKQKFKDKHMSETMRVDKSNLLYEAKSFMNFLPVSASSYFEKTWSYDDYKHSSTDNHCDYNKTL